MARLPKPSIINESIKPWDVRSARHKTGLTMEEAGNMVYVSRATWLAWERNPDHPDHKVMHPAFAELFSLKSGLISLGSVSPQAERLLKMRQDAPQS